MASYCTDSDLNVLGVGVAVVEGIAPSYRADMLLLPDLESFVPELVLKRGKPVVEIPPAPVPDWVRHTVRVLHTHQKPGLAVADHFGQPAGAGPDHRLAERHGLDGHA